MNAAKAAGWWPLLLRCHASSLHEMLQDASLITGKVAAGTAVATLATASSATASQLQGQLQDFCKAAQKTLCHLRLSRHFHVQCRAHKGSKTLGGHASSAALDPSVHGIALQLMPHRLMKDDRKLILNATPLSALLRPVQSTLLVLVEELTVLVEELTVLVLRQEKQLPAAAAAVGAPGRGATQAAAAAASLQRQEAVQKLGHT